MSDTLYDRLVNLLDGQLAEVVYRAQVPTRFLSNGTRAQRAIDVAAWAAQDPENASRAEEELRKTLNPPAPQSTSLTVHRRRIAVVCVKSELGDTAKAVARELRALSSVRGALVLDAADTATDKAAGRCDLTVILLGGRTGGTDILTTLAGSGALLLRLDRPDVDALPEDELAEARALRKGVKSVFQDAKGAARLARQLVTDRLQQGTPSVPGAEATMTAWELAYLRDQVGWWEEGVYEPLLAAAGGVGLKRRDLYVSLRAEPQPWCHVSKGKLWVKPEPATSGKRRKSASFTEEEKRAPAFLEQAVSHPRLPFLVLEGGPGCGKSVLLQHTAYVLAARHLGAEAPDHKLDLKTLAAGAPLLRIPVLIEASEIANAMRDVGRESALVEAVRRAFSGVRDGVRELDRADLLARLEAGRYLILVDALDEVPGVAARQEVALCFQGFANRGWPCRAVLTTRPPVHTGAQLPSALRVLPLATLGKGEVQALVERWCRARGYRKSAEAGVWTALDGIHERYDAATLLDNPLLLTCLLLVYHQERALPDSPEKLYREMVQILCKAKPSATLSADQRIEALQRVMHFIQRQGGTQARVRDVAEELLRWKPDLSTVDRAEELLDHELVLCTGILRVVADGNTKIVRPWHRSFQEYLTARELAAGREAAETQADRLFHAPAVIFEPSWDGTLTFLVGAHGRAGSDRARAYLERLFERSAELPTREGRLLGLVASGVADYPEYFEGHPLRDAVRERIVERFAVAGASWPWRDRVLALEALGSLGDPRLVETNRWVDIPAGEITIGRYDQAYLSLPEGRVRVAAFRIARWPVTVAEYLEFGKSGRGPKPPDGWRVQLRHPSRPVVNVSWLDAASYCRWATESQLGWLVTLPTETEWEFVARGPDACVWACGGEPGAGDAALANYIWDGEPSPGAWTPVGAFPGGHRQGIWDLAGNVWEWCHSRSKPGGAAGVWPEGDDDGDREDINDILVPRVVRGGSWDYPARYLTSAFRYSYHPGRRFRRVGFRVVCRRPPEH